MSGRHDADYHDTRMTKTQLLGALTVLVIEMRDDPATARYAKRIEFLIQQARMENNPRRNKRDDSKREGR